jgi:hypothetical protein
MLDDVQAYAAFAELGAEGDEVQDRSAEAVQSRDLQRVAIAQQPQDDVELRSAGLRAARVVDVDVVMGDAGATERVDLVVGILVTGRDAGIAEDHSVENTDWPGVCRRSFPDTGSRHRRPSNRVASGPFRPGCRQTNVCRRWAGGTPSG